MGCTAPLGATATAHETRKTVTALLCDLVGSTILGERHDPEVLRPLLHTYFAEMRATVEGQGFHRGAVAALLPKPARAGLDTCLRSLVRKELISPERSSLPGQDACRFRHLLIRDAADDAIPKSACSELHGAFADWLEGVAGDRIAEQQEIVGYHLERSYRYREELRLPEDRELQLRAGMALAAAGSREFLAVLPG